MKLRSLLKCVTPLTLSTTLIGCSLFTPNSKISAIQEPPIIEKQAAGKHTEVELDKPAEPNLIQPVATAVQTIAPTMPIAKTKTKNKSRAANQNMPPKVFYKKNEFELDYELISGHAQFLANFKSASITLTAFTDGYGSERANLHVSKKRVDLIQSYLVAEGVSDHQIKSDLSKISFGNYSQNQSSDKARFILMTY